MRPKANIPAKQANRPDISLKEYLGAHVFEKAVELYEYLRAPLFKKRDTGISYRYFDFWIERNVLPPNDKYERLNFIEFFWLQIISRLKDFGVKPAALAALRNGMFKAIEIKGLPDKREQIKGYIKGMQITKAEKERLIKALETEGPGNIDTGVTVLELLLHRCILMRKALAIGVFTNGTYLIIDRENESKYSPEHLQQLSNSHYVHLSLSKILSDYLKTEVAIRTVPELKLLTDAENKLYSAIKTGDYESITVRFKDKKIKTLELKTSVKTNRKIIDVLSEGDFAEIVVKKHNGEITRIEQNIKINY
jgi:hypothetical protein